MVSTRFFAHNRVGSYVYRLLSFIDSLVLVVLTYKYNIFSIHAVVLLVTFCILLTPLQLNFLLQLNMVQKRPFGEEELYEVSSKQPRHVEPSRQLVSFLEFPCESVAPPKCYTSG